MTPLLFALLISCPFFIGHYFIARHADKKLQRILYPVFVIKIFVALTMGHYDIYRFIVFIQSFVQSPALNPWDFSLSHPQADFPYPPILLYIHAAFFLPFKELLGITDPLIPSVYGYSIIRIPFLIADLVLLRFLLKELNNGAISKKRFLLFYLCNAVVLFHQYYSGQFDLIAVIPFLFALHLYNEKKADGIFFFLYITLSLLFKPFALLFFPLIVVHAFQRSRYFFKVIVMLGAAFLLFKISEYPFLLTTSYSALMGKGAKSLLEGQPYSNIVIFPFVYLVIVIFQLLRSKRNTSVIEPIVLLMLAMASTTSHSAGWMTWLVILMLYYRRTILKGEFILWILWNICFVLRWLTVPNSPVADSFAVFTERFLNLDTHFTMGELFHYISRMHGQDKATLLMDLSHILFLTVSSILFLFYLYRMFFIVDNKMETEKSI